MLCMHSNIGGMRTSPITNKELSGLRASLKLYYEIWRQAKHNAASWIQAATDIKNWPKT